MTDSTMLTIKQQQALPAFNYGSMNLLSWAFLFAVLAILLFYFPKGLVIALVGGVAIGLMAGGFKVQDIF